jgi:hypothetical protein
MHNLSKMKRVFRDVLRRQYDDVHWTADVCDTPMIPAAGSGVLAISLGQGSTVGFCGAQRPDAFTDLSLLRQSHYSAINFDTLWAEDGHWMENGGWRENSKG